MKEMILFLDDNYLFANKPSGVITHASVDKSRRHFYGELKEYMERQGLPSEIGLHHRLDVETSGVMIFSRNKEAAKVLDDYFKQRKIKKYYLALTMGRYREAIGEYKNGVSLKKVLGKEKCMLDEGLEGDFAHLNFTVQKEFESSFGVINLVLFLLHTGRRHQIRAQSAFFGHPLVGDTFYGGCIASHLYLHSTKISFLDPLSNKLIEVESPLPEYFLSPTKGSLQDESLVAKNLNIIVLNKPYGVVSQFSGDDSNLSQFKIPADFYPAGRLDKDSEGLLVLSNNGKLIEKISAPFYQKKKYYWVQVERIPSEDALHQMRHGLDLGEYTSRPSEVRFLSTEEVAMIPPRNPPIRFRKKVPDCWLEIIISEGKNRQVRKMTAKINHPTLRLMRIKVGDFSLIKNNSFILASGEWIAVAASEVIKSR